MSGETEVPDSVARRRTSAVASCDLCGHDRQHALADADTSRCRIVMCKHCGLFFASPSLSTDLLGEFYDEEFEGDAGTNKRVNGGDIEPRKITVEDRIARTWAMPLIERWIEVSGKRVLDIRCRSGALAEALSEAGATVTAIDPLMPNVSYAQRRSAIHDVRFVSIDEFERLSGFDDEQFDIITVLSIHLLSHSPSPRKLMERLYALLKPGGYLFLDEKDVFYPVRAIGETVFDSGPAHFFHFTTETLRKYYQRVGFEILQCDIDPVRKKSSRHIRSVVRKPETVLRDGAENSVVACDADQVVAALARADRKLRRNNGFNKFMRKARRAARRLWK